MKFQKTRESTMVYIASIFLIIQLVVSLIYSFEWNEPHYGVFSNIVFTISMVAYILFAFIILFDNRKMHEYFIIISVIALIVSSLWSIIESIQYVNLLIDMLNGLIDLEETFIMPIESFYHSIGYEVIKISGQVFLMGLGAVLLASRLTNKLDKTMYIILKVVAYIIAFHRAILLLTSIDGYMIVINLCYLVTHILLAVFIGNDMYVNTGKNDKILNDDLHYKG